MSRLTIVGLQATIRYDPMREQRSYGSNGGDPFASYLADIMGKRVDDYFRSKAEGFGDRRYGNDNRVVLDDDPDPADHDTDFDQLVDDVSLDLRSLLTGEELFGLFGLAPPA